MAEAQASQEDGGGDLVAETLAYLARAIVTEPDEVRVEAEPDDRGTRYRLVVHPDDLGRVIGRGGRIARALRQVTRAAAAREDVRALIQIGD